MQGVAVIHQTFGIGLLLLMVAVCIGGRSVIDRATLSNFLMLYPYLKHTIRKLMKINKTKHSTFSDSILDTRVLLSFTTGKMTSLINVKVFQGF